MKSRKDEAMPVAELDKNNEDVLVRILDDFGAASEIIVRNTNKKRKLEDREYSIYQIVKLTGFEKEAIFHRTDRGIEALLSVVFLTLAEATRREQEKTGPA